MLLFINAQSEWWTLILKIVTFMTVSCLCHWFAPYVWIISGENGHVGERTLHHWCSKFLVQEECCCWSRSVVWSFKQVWVPAGKHIESKPQSFQFSKRVLEGAGTCQPWWQWWGVQRRHSTLLFFLENWMFLCSSILHCCREPWSGNCVNNWFHQLGGSNETS